MPIQTRIHICIISEILHMLQNLNYVFTLIHSSASVPCFIVLISVIEVLIFNILEIVPVLKFSEK